MTTGGPTTGGARPHPIALKLAVTFVVGGLLGAASIVQFVPAYTGAAQPGTEALSGSTLTETTGGGEVVGETGAAGTTGKGGGGGTAVASTGGGSGGGQTLAPTRAGLTCSSSGNGGATDQGVTDSSIQLATTVAESGFAAAFLGEVRYGMEAVRNRINREGGICGRQLDIEYRDDAWDAARGAQYLRNFIQQKVFAIPVAPSSEGLRVVIDSGDVDGASIPVVGTDGMLIDQYEKPDGSAQPWVWPIASATVSSARIMCHDAYRRGARNFSIVFDKNYKFGVEGAEAFNDCVKEVTGKDIPGYNADYNCNQSFCGIPANASSYAQEAARFVEGDYVGLFLEPKTAEKWMGDPNTSAASTIKFGYGGAQPLFTRSFAVNCQEKCHGLQLWTGFKPPIEDYAKQPAVARYVSDLKRTKPDADEYNAFTQGGYVGMLLLEAALKKVGPEVTRERLKIALDGTCLASGLTIQPKICFSPGNRYANVTMQAFEIQYRGQFAGWRAGSIVKDSGR